MPASGTADGTEKAANASSGPGSRLRQAREAQGLQLEEVANELRVGAVALAALEEDRFEALGAAVFAKGYLKQYGARLGLDVRELLKLYERAAGESDVALAPTKGIRLRDERQISLWVLAAFALVAVVGGLSYWWWQQSAIDATALSAGVSPEADAPSANDVGSDGNAVVGEGEAVAAAPAAEQETGTAAETGPELASNLAAESPEVAGSASPEATAPPAGADVEAAVASAVETPAALDGPVLELVFVEDSWAEITDEEGSRLFRDLGEAGTRTELPADRNLSIYLGNASGVELRIDGTVVPVPGAAQRDVVRFDLDDVMD